MNLLFYWIFKSFDVRLVLFLKFLVNFFNSGGINLTAESLIANASNWRFYRYLNLRSILLTWILLSIKVCGESSWKGPTWLGFLNVTIFESPIGCKVEYTYFSCGDMLQSIMFWMFTWFTFIDNSFLRIPADPVALLGVSVPPCCSPPGYSSSPSFCSILSFPEASCFFSVSSSFGLYSELSLILLSSAFLRIKM